MRVYERTISWDHFDGMLVATLLAKFKMLDIEWYTSIGFSHIHLKLYSIVMRALGLDEI